MAIRTFYKTVAHTTSVATTTNLASSIKGLLLKVQAKAASTTATITIFGATSSTGVLIANENYLSSVTVNTTGNTFHPRVGVVTNANAAITNSYTCYLIDGPLNMIHSAGAGTTTNTITLIIDYDSM